MGSSYFYNSFNLSNLIDKLNKFIIKRLKRNKFIFALDDTSLPKKGNESVGVARQYCGALSKISNCQVIVTLHAQYNEDHFPVAAKLYLPESWIQDPKRIDKAKIPNDQRFFKEKWKIALELIDQNLTNYKMTTLLFDAGYGCNRNFLSELDKVQTASGTENS
jgi:SRSO17 transposase